MLNRRSPLFERGEMFLASDKKKHRKKVRKHLQKKRRRANRHKNKP
jgi:hypothetical protein